jgi:hypothetical protein
MTRSGVARAFGARTMGLGGNVEEIAVLNHSFAKVRLTRGLTTTASSDGNYPTERFLENNGVQPSNGLAYTHTVDDVRAGYVKAFSDAAVQGGPVE